MGFLTLLKGRGRGLYRSEASARVDIDTAYGRRPLEVVMHLQANLNTATDWRTTLRTSTAIHLDRSRPCACTNKTQTLLEYAIWREPGSLVEIQEDITGIDGIFRIQGVVSRSSMG